VTGRAPRRPLRVVLVCMGNICRSPMAEAVLRRRLEEAGLAELVEVDSAGTYGGHAGEPPDRRAREAGQRRGYDLRGQRARGLSREDREADLVLAMDRGNLRRVRQLLGDHPGVHLFLEASGSPSPAAEIPDPYYGGDEGFERVLDLIEAGAAGWVERLRAELGAEKTPPGGSGT
jgi:protein-tyrosine phosphatase